MKIDLHKLNIPFIFIVNKFNSECNKLIDQFEKIDFCYVDYSDDKLGFRVERLINKENDVIDGKDFCLDIQRQIFKNRNFKINLTAIETRIMEILINNLNKLILPEQISKFVWGNEYK